MSSQNLVGLYILLSYSKSETLNPIPLNLKHPHLVELYELASHSREQRLELKLIVVQQDIFGH